MKEKYLDILKNISILIVEDNESQREELKEIISLFCENTLTATHGIEGLVLFKEKKPNIIITDIKMPKLDGLDLAKEIRLIDKNIPIIVLSAYLDKDLLLDAVPLHLSNYLTKPISQNDLLNNLKEVVDFMIKNSLLEVKLLDGYRYCMIDKCIYKEDEKIKLTKKEVNFIEFLLQRKNQFVNKDDIERLIWSDSIMTTAALKNFIFKLRKKIGVNSLISSSSNGFSIQTL